MSNDSKNKLINGPVNVLRLEGNVNGVKKVIYLFMDYHVPITNQKQCENIFNYDIQTYFADSFNELNNKSKKYDFFIELHPTLLSNNLAVENILPLRGRQRYIEEVIKLVRKLFLHDPKNNKVMVNELFKNIRLHYLDIRDYYDKFFNGTNRILSIVDHTIHYGITLDNINLIIESLKEIRSYMEFLINVMTSPDPYSASVKPIIIKNANEEEAKKSLESDIKYLSNKIKSKYSNPNIKNFIHLLNKNSISGFKNIISFIDTNIDILNYYHGYLSNNPINKLIFDETDQKYYYGPSYKIINKIIRDMYDMPNDLIYKYLIPIFARFTDIFFLRRFLDKSYITNTIVYSGAEHSEHYINILVKDFDFHITHASYSKISNMDELTNKIKNGDNITVEELLLPEIFRQCSNMNDFPKDFE